MKKKITGSLMLLMVLALIIPIGLNAKVVKIGVQAPITGKYANEGQGIDQAVRLIVEQKNAQGGLLGNKIEVISEDDEGTAVKAAFAAKNLINKKVMAVIGSYTSTCAAAPQKMYYKAGVLQTSDGTSDALTKHAYWTFFRNSNPNSAEAIFTANHFINQRHYKKVAILSDYSSFAVGLGDAVKKEIEKLGGDVVYYGKIKAGNQNFTPILTKIKSLHPDVIYFSGYYSDGGLLRSQQVQLDIKADFYGGDANDNVDFVKLAGSAASGSYLINVPTPTLLPYDDAKKFLADYEKKYGMKIPSIWTILNVDGLRAIMYAAEQTNSLDTKVIANFLHNMKKPFPGFTGPLSWDKKGERIGSSYFAYEIQPDNSYKVISK